MWGDASPGSGLQFLIFFPFTVLIVLASALPYLTLSFAVSRIIILIKIRCNIFMHLFQFLNAMRKLIIIILVIQLANRFIVHALAVCDI